MAKESIRDRGSDRRRSDRSLLIHFSPRPFPHITMYHFSHFFRAGTSWRARHSGYRDAGTDIVDGRRKLEPWRESVRPIRRGRRSCHERSHGDLLDHAPDRPGIDQPLSWMGYRVGACARSFYYSHAHRHRPRDRKTAPNRSRR